MIEGVILEVPAPVPPSEHRIKYRLVYIVDGQHVVGYDNERGKGDHKHIRGAQRAYRFKDVPTLHTGGVRESYLLLPVIPPASA